MDQSDRNKEWKPHNRSEIVRTSAFIKHHVSHSKSFPLLAEWSHRVASELEQRESRFVMDDGRQEEYSTKKVEKRNEEASGNCE
jgi:hypothetical protein